MGRVSRRGDVRFQGGVCDAGSDEPDGSTALSAMLRGGRHPGRRRCAVQRRKAGAGGAGAMKPRIELARKSGFVQRPGDLERGLALVREWQSPARGWWMVIHARSGAMLLQVRSRSSAHRARQLLLESTDWDRPAIEISPDKSIKRRCDEIKELLRLNGDVV